LFFGDPDRLTPYRLAGNFHEFGENSKLSVLGWLGEKSFPIIHLDIQYRMAPSIAQWPAGFSYQNKHANHTKAVEDSHACQIARRISKDIYGVNGYPGQGFECFPPRVISYFQYSTFFQFC